MPNIVPQRPQSTCCICKDPHFSGPCHWESKAARIDITCGVSAGLHLKLLSFLSRCSRLLSKKNPHLLLGRCLTSFVQALTTILYLGISFKFVMIVALYLTDILPDQATALQCLAICQIHVPDYGSLHPEEGILHIGRSQSILLSMARYTARCHICCRYTD